MAVPREIIPIATVLGNSLHLLIQMALLLVFALFEIRSVNRYWLWLPLIWIDGSGAGVRPLADLLGDQCVCARHALRSGVLQRGAVLAGADRVHPTVPSTAAMFALNPVAALVVALRDILMDGKSPPASLLTKLSVGSVAVLVLGLVLFRRMRQGFYDYL